MNAREKPTRRDDCGECGGKECYYFYREQHTYFGECIECGIEDEWRDEDAHGCMAVPWGGLL